MTFPTSPVRYEFDCRECGGHIIVPWVMIIPDPLPPPPDPLPPLCARCLMLPGWSRDEKLSAVMYSEPPHGRGVFVPACAYCGSCKFRAGPTSGLSVNICCANNKCRHWFTWTPSDEQQALRDLHDIEPILSHRKGPGDQKLRGGH